MKGSGPGRGRENWESANAGQAFVWPNRFYIDERQTVYWYFFSDL